MSQQHGKFTLSNYNYKKIEKVLDTKIIEPIGKTINGIKRIRDKFDENWITTMILMTVNGIFFAQLFFRGMFIHTLNGIYSTNQTFQHFVIINATFNETLTYSHHPFGMIEQHSVYQYSVFFCGGFVSSMIASYVTLQRSQRMLFNSLFMFIFGCMLVGSLTGQISYEGYEALRYIMVDFMGGFFFLLCIHQYSSIALKTDFNEKKVTEDEGIWYSPSVVFFFSALFGPFVSLLFVLLMFPYIYGKPSGMIGFNIVGMITFFSFIFMRFLPKIKELDMDNPNPNKENTACPPLYFVKFVMMLNAGFLQAMYYPPIIFIHSQMAFWGCTPYEIWISVIWSIMGAILGRGASQSARTIGKWTWYLLAALCHLTLIASTVVFSFYVNKESVMTIHGMAFLYFFSVTYIDHWFFGTLGQKWKNSSKVSIPGRGMIYSFCAIPGPIITMLLTIRTPTLSFEGHFASFWNVIFIESILCTVFGVLSIILQYCFGNLGEYKNNQKENQSFRSF